MELGRKTALIEYFNHLFVNMFSQVMDYDTNMREGERSTRSDPAHAADVALTAAAVLKLSVANHFHGFGQRFGNFVDSLDGTERESVAKLRFLFDELRKNQAAINAIYDAYQARLEGLADPENTKGILDVDLKSLSINDAIIIAESSVLFNTALRQIFPREYANVRVALVERYANMVHFDDRPVRKAIGSKMAKLEGLGMAVTPGEREAFGHVHGL